MRPTFIKKLFLLIAYYEMCDYNNCLRLGSFKNTFIVFNVRNAYKLVTIRDKLNRHCLLVSR